MSHLIREYSAKDRSALEGLMVELQQNLVEMDPLKRMHCLPEYGPRYVDDLLQKIREGDGRIFVAEDEGIIVGCSACILLQYGAVELLNEQLHSEGRMLELVVLPAMRGRGIGTALMHAAEEYLQSKGCSAVRIEEVFVPNVTARRLYEKLGYADRMVDMLKVFS